MERFSDVNRILRAFGPWWMPLIIVRVTITQKKILLVTIYLHTKHLVGFVILPAGLCGRSINCMYSQSKDRMYSVSCHSVQDWNGSCSLQQLMTEKRREGRWLFTSSQSRVLLLPLSLINIFNFKDSLNLVLTSCAPPDLSAMRPGSNENSDPPLSAHVLAMQVGVVP
jgi:hypothetical protein